jgi:hypothetical protein
MLEQEFHTNTLMKWLRFKKKCHKMCTFEGEIGFMNVKEDKIHYGCIKKDKPS